MQKSRFVLMVAAGLLAAGTASAQQVALTTKVGFVDTERVMREARAPAQAQKDLEAEFAKRDKALTPGADIERRRAAIVEDMTQKRDEVLKQIVAKANAMIKRVAEEEKLDAVFLEAAYVSPRIDITAKVIKALDAAP